jgi:glycosyltransferase involved in cell wall biosynthesis
MSHKLYNSVIFWQSTPSPHQAAYIRSLTEASNLSEVKLFLSLNDDKQRNSMGWHKPDYGSVHTIHLANKATVDSTITLADGNTVSIFSEFVADSNIRNILQRSCQGEGIIGLISEGRDWRGLKGSMRLMHSYICERRYVNRINFILAIGNLAKEWYMRCGFNPEIIFDFCYVVEKPIGIEQIHTDKKEPLKLIFVGQIIPRKRLDLLLQALINFSSIPWTLRVIGNGSELETLVNFSRHNGLSDKIRFLGVMDNHHVRLELASADVLVLPSDWDGWGAVVNEALMSGVRVICSDYCGSAELIRRKDYGYVFRANSLDSLVQVLQQQFSEGPVSWQDKQAVMRYSEAFCGPSVARYLSEIIGFVTNGNQGIRPVAPWKIQPE